MWPDQILTKCIKFIIPYRDSFPLSDMFKLIHYETRTVGKWVVRIRLKCLFPIRSWFITNRVNSPNGSLTSIQTYTDTSVSLILGLGQCYWYIVSRTLFTACQWCGKGNVFSRVCCPSVSLLSTGGPTIKAPAPRHVQTCSTWISMYRDSLPLSDMFKLIHYETRTVGKRVVRIRLKCLFPIRNWFITNRVNSPNGSLNSIQTYTDTSVSLILGLGQCYWYIVKDPFHCLPMRWQR